MNRRTQRCAEIAGLILGIALALAFGLWVAGGCSHIKKYRPPAIVQLGVQHLPQRPLDRENLGIARLIVPIRPVGAWADVRYSFHESNVESVGGGLIFYFPGGEAFEEKKQIPEVDRDLLEVP